MNIFGSFLRKIQSILVSFFFNFSIMYLNFRDKNQYCNFFFIFGAKIQIPYRQDVTQITFSMQ